MAKQVPARQRKTQAHFREDDIDIAPNTLRPLNRPPLSRGIAMPANIDRGTPRALARRQLAQDVIPGGAVNPAAVINHDHVFTLDSLPIQTVAQSSMRPDDVPTCAPATHRKTSLAQHSGQNQSIRTFP